MKTFFAVVMLSVALYACQGNASSSTSTAPAANAQQALNDTTSYTTIQWIDSVYNFGTVTKGEQVKMTFKFKNTGNKPLIISSAKPGCGCTVADFTKEPVPPGGEGEVTGVYDSNRGILGTVHKSISVTTNTKNGVQHTLIFTGEVKGGEEKSKS
ncbi:DUF1573 domain-containing protein [Foetidibacter luteolus]|uniref:DUF1573 domain-containing protein n=1 Tax=Foetidibacter luteolus TaxID=2608880 RepID=UPI001A9864CE|nr:DUF1573 domain-containing protein [Foetidibacter luteolus]